MSIPFRPVPYLAANSRKKPFIPLSNDMDMVEKKWIVLTFLRGPRDLFLTPFRLWGSGPFPSHRDGSLAGSR